MLRARYDHGLAAGTIAASGTLGVLIPPSIMLMVMAEMFNRSVGTLFFAALIPGLMLAAFYAVFVMARAAMCPDLAPKPDLAALDGSLLRLIIAGLAPPAALIVLVLGSILAGWASPIEAAGVGAFGALILGLFLPPVIDRTAFPAWVRNFPALLRDVTERSALTGGMLVGIFIGATAFSLVFRTLGGDDAMGQMIEGTGLGA
jgi:TRAP-type mannitol/chloroaromatic compound transport system permease large subunit